MAQITIDIDGDVQLSRELLRVRDRSANLRPVFSSLADDFYDMERKQFATEGQFASGGWAALAPSTLMQKTGRSILRETDALFTSLTGGAGGIEKITSDELVLGTDVEYARYHQHGTRRMPQRRPVEMRAADRVRWIKALQAYIAGGAESSTFSSLVGVGAL